MDLRHLLPFQNAVQPVEMCLSHSGMSFSCTIHGTLSTVHFAKYERGCMLKPLQTTLTFATNAVYRNECGTQIKAMGIAWALRYIQHTRKRYCLKLFEIALSRWRKPVKTFRGQMNEFYINCLETLYPPGKCGETCDSAGTCKLPHSVE